MYFGVCLDSPHFVILYKSKSTQHLVVTLENNISKLKYNGTKETI